MMKRFLILPLAVLLCLPSLKSLEALEALNTVEIQGISIPPTIQLAGQTLQLNGAGLRTFTFLMVPIKIYVASLYTPTVIRSAATALEGSAPMEFDFTFLRAVGQDDVTKAWSSQFDQSVSYTYPGYARDRDTFIGMFGPLQSMGVEQVQFVGTNTVVFDQGTQKGSIPGRDFQKAFLSLWFGSKPVASDLQRALLGRDKVTAGG
jgi:hypothetical protein